MSKLVSLERVQQEFPDWPYGPWSTRRLVRLGQLGSVRVGRRIFVTRELLDAFVERHTVDGGAQPTECDQRRAEAELAAEHQRKGPP